MSSFDGLAAGLDHFSEKLREELVAELETTAPRVLDQVRAHALAILPHTGGLNAYVASSRMTATVRGGGGGATVRLTGSKTGHDLLSIDNGRVRAPNWGRRKNRWHSQTVTPGFFSDPASKFDPWRDACARAAERAAAAVING